MYEQVANRLRERIYDGLLSPGEAIDEPALCGFFGISRTPLREALKVLDREGLLELVPRKGCVVRSLSLEELGELFPVIAMLEGLCARLAANHCTEADLAQLEAMHQQIHLAEQHAAERKDALLAPIPQRLAIVYLTSTEQGNFIRYRTTNWKSSFCCPWGPWPAPWLACSELAVAPSSSRYSPGSSRDRGCPPRY